MVARSVSLLIAVWASLAPAVLALGAAEAVSRCCGDARPSCCCCEAADDLASTGPGARESHRCPCSEPLDGPAPRELPATPSGSDVRPNVDASGAEPVPAPAAAGPAFARPSETFGVPPPGPPLAVLFCIFLI